MPPATLLRASLAAALVALSAGQATPNCTAPPPSPAFDHSAMNGVWYEIVRIQTAGGNALQQFCACTALVVSDDAGNKTRGNKDVVNSCRFEGPSGVYINATSYLIDMGPDGHWNEVYFPGGPPASYNIIIAGTDPRGIPYAVEYDCSNNALFGDNYCIHVLSRAPTGFPAALAEELVQQTTVTMGLNPLNRPVNYTRQDGCW